MTSDRNDSVKILNHWDSFLPDISASILKNNYAKLLARSICSEYTGAADLRLYLGICKKHTPKTGLYLRANVQDRHNINLKS